MRHAWLLVFVGCGARTALDEPFDASEPLPDVRIDVARDAPTDVTIDALPDVDEGDGGACELGPNIQFPTGDCGGDQIDWFATPYTPPTDITVERIEAHMAQGNVALLTSSAGAPGSVLFVGSVGTSPMPAWIGTNVNPPVVLQGGTLYYIGFQGDCSFSVGGSEPIEYMAPTVNGPWHDQGTDNWTARLFGTCP